MSSSMIRPRIKAIIRHRNSLISLMLALLAFGALTFSALIPVSPSVRVLDLLGPLLAFTSMGLVVAITSLALILALPLSRSVALMVVNSADPGDNAVQVEPLHDELIAKVKEMPELTNLAKSKPRSGYLDLVFVFVWTALSNVISSVTAIVWGLAVGNEPVLNSDLVLSHILSALVVGAVTYSTLQMVSAISTVYQVADLLQGTYLSQIVDQTRRAMQAGHYVDAGEDAATSTEKTSDSSGL